MPSTEAAAKAFEAKKIRERIRELRRLQTDAIDYVRTTRLAHDMALLALNGLDLEIKRLMAKLPSYRARKPKGE